MKINLFPPYRFEFDRKYFLSFLKSNSDLHWASSGTASLFYICSALKIQKILLPSFICQSVINPIKALNIDYEFINTDTNTLLPDIFDFQSKITSYKPDAVLWPTLFGLTQDLQHVSEICKKSNVLLVNDLAQSYGCSWNNINLMKFGDASFFAFSPGKPTAGHLGAFFRLNNLFNENKSGLGFSYFVFFNFYIQRYKQFILPRWISQIMNKLFNRHNIHFNQPALIDQMVCGGILKREDKSQTKTLRQLKFTELASLFTRVPSVKIFNTQKISESNPHKLVILLNHSDEVICMIRFFLKRGIQTTESYKSLNRNEYSLVNLENRLIEIPILETDEQHQFLMKAVVDYIAFLQNKVH